MDSRKSPCKATSTGDANIPPKDHCGELYLFLLEFYVREITSSRLAKLNEMFFVPTTVSFCFLDFQMDDALQLTPVDPMFEPQAGIADDIEFFNNGRSVMFALKRETLINMQKDFTIDVSVFKKMPSDIKPDVLVGKAQIDMSLHFTALRKEMIDATKYPDAALPLPSKSVECEVPLIFCNAEIGSMCAFARITGYGQTIVTEFESPCVGIARASSFLFRAEDRLCEGKSPLGYKCRLIEPERCDLESLLSNSTGSRQPDCMVCKPPKLPCAPCRTNSGAGVATTTRHSSRKDCASAGAAPKSFSPCVSDGCKPIQTSRGPKEPCGKAVVLKVSGLVDICDQLDGKPPQPARVTVTGEDEALNPEDLGDPDHDVFVLRIGKKGLVGAGEKSDIQLEMRTPKGPDKRPALRLETREMQTEEDKSAKKAAKNGGGGGGGNNKKKK